MVFIGILSMSELRKPQPRVSDQRGCEVVSFQLRANSTRQILPSETWYRRGIAPYAKRTSIRVGSADRGRIVEQSQPSDPGVTVAVP